MISEASIPGAAAPVAIPPTWLALGFLGQALFASRFVVQWVASERRRASVVPDVFWWLSIGGGVCLLGYALLRRDAVIVVGQLAGLFVYTRNVALARRRPGA